MAAPVGVMSGCGLVSTYWEHIDHVDVVISLVSEIILMTDDVCKTEAGALEAINMSSNCLLLAHVCSLCWLQFSQFTSQTRKYPDHGSVKTRES